MKNSSNKGITGSVSSLFLGKLTMDNLGPSSTPEALCQKKLQKCQDTVDETKKEIKSRDIVINDLRKKIDELKKITGIQQAVSMRNMNLNLQLDLTPTIAHKNELKDEYERLQVQLKKSKERENELIQSIERVKLKGRRVRAEFHSRVNKLENEIEKWKIPLVRMDLRDKLYRNNSLATAKVMFQNRDKNCDAIKTSHEQKDANASIDLLRIQKQCDRLGRDIKNLEKYLNDWDELKDAEKKFGCLSNKTKGLIQSFTTSLDPWIHLVQKEISRKFTNKIISNEESQILALERISEAFETCQKLSLTLKVLYYYLKATLVYSYNNFTSDIEFRHKMDGFFEKFINESIYESTNLLLFQFPKDRKSCSSITSREKKLDTIEQLNSLLEEQKKAVSSLGKMSSHSRKRSKELMLTQINQMNEIKYSIKHSSNKLSESEKNSTLLALTCDEYEGRIKVLEIMKQRSSADGLAPTSIFWALR